ncbi:MAG: M48 family metallopeptidase [Myxococcales bacterium]|nr:M48 family metallopeptidase [Myxococcales bacterium]
MDFFEHQDAARKQTSRLVFLFVLAVLAIIASVCGLFAGIVFYGSQDNPEIVEHLLTPRFFLTTAGITLFVIGAGSLYKIASLGKGGSRVAESLRGRPVLRNTTDLHERRLLNVVEEMAIASGIAVPQVYVLDQEQGINAFAAGFSPDDAVIGVTRGTLETLDREQLQGVIAHEFSHIFNGDMRLNIRLIGVLHGILLLGLLGRILLRFGGGSRRRSSRKNDGGGAIIVIGIGLMLIGFVGTLFGNLIKAAVSRQREFLADASAVQFTRNPQGIAGALRAIATATGLIDAPKAAEASHMFFGSAINLGSLTATHPPLDERISRIEGQAARLVGRATEGAAGQEGVAGIAGFAGGPTAARRGPPPTTQQEKRRGTTRSAPPVVATHAVQSVGTPTHDHLDRARALLDSTPPLLRNAAADPFGARAVVYSLLLDPDDAIRKKQVDGLSQQTDSPTLAQTLKFMEPASALSREHHITLLELAIPALRALSNDQYAELRRNVSALAAADRKIDLFEWMLERLLVRHVSPAFERVHPPAVRHRSLKGHVPQLNVLLSTLARAGSTDTALNARAFEMAAGTVGLPLQFLPREQCHLGALDRALDVLREAAPLLKRDVLEAAATAVLFDSTVSSAEAQLLRAVADSLDCPMPPLLA